MIRVELERVSVSYGDAQVLRELTLSAPGAGWLGLIGPNGAGKTTLLRAIAGLTPFSGDVRIGGRSVAHMGRRRLARTVAYVPQRPMIPPAMTVVDYVLMGRTPYIPYLGSESRLDLGVVGELLARLELQTFADRAVSSLSGGELQRAVLARALAQQGSVLLLDEPTSALDIGHQQAVLELVDALRTDHDLTVISAMHDLTLAGQFADPLVLLDEGRVIACGHADEVLTEATIGRHYGARVTIVRDGDGVVVLPRRARDDAAAASR